jgi:hypothetical protein
MSALTSPETRSFFACGDFNQRDLHGVGRRMWTMKVSPPVLAKNTSEQSDIVNWLSTRVVEIESFVQQLPSIAVLVKR